MASTQTTSADLSTTATTTSAIVPSEDGVLLQCPNCDKKLHRFEMASHCEQEMQNLKQTAQLLTESNEVGRDEEEIVGGTTSSNDSADRRKPWTVFQRVQRNRQSRMKQRTRKRPTIPEHPCPVCNATFPQDEIQQHAEECLRRSNRTENGRSNSDDHSSNDDEGGEEYEEYEWAGQKRIRVSSLLQGGYAAIGIGQTNGSSSASHRHNGHNDDEDEDLNVDEDDTQIYGPTQYAENDVISHTVNDDESDITSYMRRLITTGPVSTNARNTNTTTTNSHSINSSIINAEINTDVIPTPSIALSSTSSAPSLATPDEPSTPAHYQQIIDSLKAKLRYYEQQHIPGKYKCLICLDDYRNPAISVCCWHVHCEQCWLRSLGARKLCPQCNLITTPKDLRRIYM
ncbi:ring finger protein 220 [Haematobia irritans]|uniref:ring finger protein 220 n=1 Tax=Haematobia irritans TaxID=7368 RepID=UPI003F4FDEF0